MGELRDKQVKLARMVPRLVDFIFASGYEVTYGDAKATKGHRPNSLHYIGLAIDLNLFKDGVYLKNTEDHLFAGEFWESIGGTWGGRFGDGNHYSLEHRGRK